MGASPAAASTHTFSGTFGEGPGNPYPLTEPTYLAIDNSAGPSAGDSYVADPANHWVQKFDPAGNLIWIAGKAVDKTAVEAAGSEAEQNLCLISSGDVCQPGTAASTPGGFETPAFLAVDSSNGPSAGDLYVADTAARLITKLAPDGSVIASWGNNGPAEAPDGQLAGAPGEPFTSTDGVAVDAAGDLIAREGPRFLRFDPAGAFVGSFDTGNGAGPSGIALDSAGDIYYTRPSGQVLEVDSTGTLIHGENNPVDPGPATGLAVDPSTDDLYVDRGTEIIRYDPAANRLESFGTGDLTAAAGLAVDSTGALYAADPAAAHVAVFSLLGPFAVTAPATAITSTEATLHGRLAPTGGGPVTACSFEYVSAEAFEASGFAGAATAPCSPPPPYAASTEVSAALTGLNGGTAYRFRLTATDSNATNFSADASFTTLGATIDSTSASAVTATSATLETELNPHGLPTTYRFEYDTAPYTAGGPAHGTALPTASAGAGEVDVTRSAQLQGLQPGTTYHFRVLAENSLGTSEGPDRAFTTQPAAAASLLPDSRGWELVSPPDKQGVPLEAISEEGGTIQAAADGHAIAYFAKGSIVSEPAGNRSFVNSQDLSTRTASGWSTHDIATPHQAPTGLVPENFSEYKLFSADLSLGALETFDATPLSPQASEPTPYLRAPDGSYVPLVHPGNVPADTHFGGVEIAPEIYAFGVTFITATPDFSHLLLESPTSLVAGFAPVGRGIYEWSAGALTPVSFVPAGTEARCGGTAPACEPVGGAAVGNVSWQVRNAISADGSRVVFKAGVKGLFLRDLARGETLLLDAPQEGATGESGRALFQDASTDGRRVFFTDPERLTPNSTAAPGKPDLYLCQIEETPGGLACALRDLSANTVDHAEPAAVQGNVIGAAADGSSVYFVANARLAPGAVSGDCIVSEGVGSGQCNLFRYDVSSGATTLVSILSGADRPDWSGGSQANLRGLTARVSPNGRFLAFMSERPLTGYDNRDVVSGQRDEEVFLYDAQGQGRLLCASCNPTGARPAGRRGPPNVPRALVDGARNWATRWYAANVPGWTAVDGVHALYQSRYLSDSGRLFFNAADALVPQDTNGTEDVYQFEPPGVGSCTEASPGFASRNAGCLSLISSGASAQESAFMDASESGNDVFFLTASRLTAKDEDGAYDLYDARVGGGEAPPLKPVECSGDACQQPAVPPNDATPGSLTFNGAGNVLQCPKGKVKKHGKCVKKQTKKKHHKNKKSHKKAHQHAARPKRGAGR